MFIFSFYRSFCGGLLLAFDGVSMGIALGSKTYSNIEIGRSVVERHGQFYIETTRNVVIP